MIKEVKITIVREVDGTKYQTINPQQAFDFWKNEVEKSSWYSEDKEHVVVLILDQKNMIKAFNLVSIGTINSSICEPREVFRPAIVAAGTAVIMMHNHPTGDTTPSGEDLNVTRKMIEAGNLLEVKLLDSIIVGHSFLSLREEGLVDFEI